MRCGNCGEPIIPNRLWGWVHNADGVGYFCATNQVHHVATPAEEA